MNKAIFIGSGFDEFISELKRAGYETIKYNKAQAALSELEQASLLVMESDHRELMKQVAAATKRVPKLLISSGKRRKSLGPWLKEPLTHIIEMPDPVTFRNYATRIVREAQRMIKADELKSEISAIRNELHFNENLNKVLSSSNEISDIVTTIINRFKETARIKAWALYMRDDDTNKMVLHHSSRSVKGKARKISFPIGTGLSGWVAKNACNLIVEDAKTDQRFRISPKTNIYTFSPTSMLGIPLMNNGKVFGVIECVKDKASGRFSQGELDMLQTLLKKSALAIERIVLQQKLEELVITDDLTNLFNMRYLNRSVDTEILRCERYSSALSVVFIDLDHFKDVNDNYGHLVGSKVLVELGQILINQLRNIDIVARYGGDEFVLVLPQTTLNNALMISERIRKALENYEFLKEDGLHLKLTASFGVAAYPETAKSKEELMRLADESMYRVKNHTRNGVYAII